MNKKSCYCYARLKVPPVVWLDVPMWRFRTLVFYLRRGGRVSYFVQVHHSPEIALLENRPSAQSLSSVHFCISKTKKKLYFTFGLGLGLATWT